MSECDLCGDTENVDGHHISYEPEEVVDLCRSCHQKVHADEEHKYHPDDSASTTSIEITTDQRDALQDRKQHGRESYKAVLDRLLADEDAQTAGIDADAVREIIRDEVVREALE